MDILEVKDSLWNFSTGKLQDSSHPLLTLLPEKIPIVNQPIAHLSNLPLKSIIAIAPGHQPSTVEDPDQHATGHVSFSNDKKSDAGTPVSTFPSNTQGFFYYHRPPDRPEISGQIRFRLCSDPASFGQGQDLTDDTSMPWHITLLNILQRKNAAFHSLLMREGILAEPLLEDIRYPRQLRRGHSKAPVNRLFSISDPYIMDLSARRLYLHFVTRKSDSLFKLIRMWIDRRRHISTKDGKRVEETLYTGVIKARFELSTNPNHDRLGPTLVLRTLDVVKPVRCLIPDYDGFIPPPVPGQLHGRMVNGVFVPWIMPLLQTTAGKKILTFLEHSTDQGGGVAPTAGDPK